MTKLRKNGQTRKTTGPLRSKLPPGASDWRKKTHPVKFDDEQKRLFLEYLAEWGLMGRSAEMANVTRESVRKHRKQDEEFARAYDDAMAKYAERVTSHAKRLALEGVKETRYDRKGNVTSEKFEYPIKILEMEMKRVEPEYRERQEVDLNHKGGVMVAPAQMDPDAWVAQQEKANETRTEPSAELPGKKE